MSPRTRRVLLPFWLACLAFAVFAQAGATWRLWVFQSFTNPAFASVGLSVPYSDYREWWAEARSAAARSAGVTPKEYVEEVNDIPLRPGARAADAARLLERSEGRTATLRLRAEGAEKGREVRLVGSEGTRQEVFANQVRWYSIVSHAADLLVALLLMVVASLLKWRRPANPVAALVSFALLFVATLGCWRLWDWFDIAWIESLLSVTWLGLLLVALPALPDGRYVPRWSRWFMLLGPAAAISLYRSESDLIDALILGATGAAILASIILRFVLTPQGPERQRMKWALLGLGAGVLLWLPGGSIEVNFWSDLPLVAKVYVFLLTRLGLATLAITLLFSLLEFRLNDVDAVLGHSLTYSAVMGVVGTVWAVGAYYAGEAMDEFARVSNEPLAVAISALLALLFFNPTKERVTKWTEGRFRGPLLRLRSLPERMTRWQLDDEPSRVAQQALAVVADSARASAAALVRGVEQGPAKVVAVYRVEPDAVSDYLAAPPPLKRADRAFPLRFESKDQAGPPIILLIGRRDDDASYSREERNALAGLVEPLADTLRAVECRADHEAAVMKALTEIKTSLLRLNAAGEGAKAGQGS